MADDANTATGTKPKADTAKVDTAKKAADTMRDNATKAKTAFEDKVVEPAKRAGEAIKASGEKIASGGTEIGGKIIDQAEANAKEAFAAMRAAANAKDLSDVMRIQGEFLREQGQRSMNHAREIGELIMQFGRDAVAPLTGTKRP